MRNTQIINGKEIAAEKMRRLASEIFKQQRETGAVPHLNVILVGEDPASHIYVKNKIARAKEVGMEVTPFFLPYSTDQESLLRLIQSQNEDDRVSGILVQLPLPEHIEKLAVINTIDPRKDVDGFTVKNVGLLNTWQECLAPSTPQGCLELIKSCLGENLAGSKAVILGRSPIVGRPMASMLIKESCTVTLLHSLSVNIASECKDADILISAIGKPHFVKGSFIKPGACVIDVGITRVDGALFGDVDFEEAMGVAGFITPVPGGVGPMTVSCMLHNTFNAFVTSQRVHDT